MKYKIIDDKILISLEKNDEILTSLYELTKNKNINSGWVDGIGACKDVEIGFYNLKSKDYLKKQFKEDYEITSLSGNFSYLEHNRSPWWHIHMNFSNKDFNVFGGHLFRATITASCEIIFHISKYTINRKLDSNIGLCLWDLNND